MKKIKPNVKHIIAMSGRGSVGKPIMGKTKLIPMCIPLPPDRWSDDDFEEVIGIIEGATKSLKESEKELGVGGLWEQPCKLITPTFIEEKVLKCRTCNNFREPAKCINVQVANRGKFHGSRWGFNMTKTHTDLRRTEMQIIDRLDRCDHYEEII